MATECFRSSGASKRSAKWSRPSGGSRAGQRSQDIEGVRAQLSWDRAVCLPEELLHFAFATRYCQRADVPTIVLFRLPSTRRGGERVLRVCESERDKDCD